MLIYVLFSLSVSIDKSNFNVEFSLFVFPRYDYAVKPAKFVKQIIFTINEMKHLQISSLVFELSCFEIVRKCNSNACFSAPTGLYFKSTSVNKRRYLVKIKNEQ